jgi:hypothetical protein
MLFFDKISIARFYFYSLGRDYHTFSNNYTRDEKALYPCGTVASNKFWPSMSFQNLVRLLHIFLKKSLPDYAHVNSVKKMGKKLQLMSYNIMIGYDIYVCFTMEHFR